MTQTVLTLLSDLVPERAAAARKSIEDLRITIEKTSQSEDPYEPVALAIPGLHFASIMVFEDERYDPLVTVELNFDGPAGVFLPQLETPLLARHLRAILRCCKPPHDGRAPMFDAVTKEGSKVPITPYLETLIVQPAVFHQGNRGLDRARILQEASLYTSVQTALDAPACRRARDASTLHAALRAAVLPDHPWLEDDASSRVSSLERALDIAKFAVFALGIFVALLVPGFVLAAAFPDVVARVSGLVLIVAVLAAVAMVLRSLLQEKPKDVRAPQLPRQTDHGFLLPMAGLIAVCVCAVLCVMFEAIRASFAGLIVIVVAVLASLRRVEDSDCIQDDPKTDPTTLQKIMTLEDQILQNHMGSLVHVKPGAVRALLIRLGLKGLGLFLRMKATDGYLANMRTIHFAHWALIDNGSRLLFFSNFDSSWESYLDDFIEKAHAGLTLAWSNGIGFPRTRFLVQDGATDGLLFKTWARHSMAPSLFWFSAYRNLSVNQVERNFAIATGLRQKSLSGPQAAQWATFL